MSKYNVNGSAAVGTSLPIVNLTGSASIAVSMYEFIIGFSSSPADVATIFKWMRSTDAGTGGTTISPEPLNPISVAATATAKQGTYGTAPATSGNKELMKLSINQRATHRWLCREGCEFKSTASSANGLMLRSESSGGTPTVDGSFYWME